MNTGERRVEFIQEKRGIQTREERIKVREERNLDQRREDLRRDNRVIKVTEYAIKARKERNQSK